jgi:hypothetical protein
MKVVRRLLLGVSILFLVSGCTSLSRWFDGLAKKVKEPAPTVATKSDAKPAEKKTAATPKTEDKKSHHQAA